MSLFIVFEGIEGCGKSTHIRRVADELRKTGLEPLVTREPGGTAAGEAIRQVALDPELDLDPIAELMLMLAARSAFVTEIIRPALESGRIVLSDRYDLSTFAYQGGGRGIGLDKIRPLNDLAIRGLKPDLYVFLDIDVETSLRRLSKGKPDRIEREGIDFHRRVAETYRELARSEPDVAWVDARGEIEDTFREVWEGLSSRFPETFASRKG